jgi:hypothetical protein
MREWLPVIGIYIPIFTLQIETVSSFRATDLSSPVEPVRPLTIISIKLKNGSTRERIVGLRATR